MSVLHMMVALGTAVALMNPVNVTVYHVNPHRYGAIPVNMDTGDAMGDCFFDLAEVVVAPLACADPTHQAHGCANEEAVGQDLMVNKLVLEVEDAFSLYAKCNIGVNGSDGHGHSCQDDTYCCYCMDDWDRTLPCNATVGRQNLFEHYGTGGGSRRHDFCHRGSRPSDCYTSNVVEKLSAQLPGYWYSTLAEDYCGGGAEDCTWRVARVEKIVTRECHTRVFGAVVQAAAPRCFESCGSQMHNTSSPCWVDCFYKAALGPDAGEPGGAVAGMSPPELVAAWERPFLSEAEGGCPPQKELPSPFL